MTKERVFLLVSNWEASRSLVSKDSCLDSSKIDFVGIPIFPAEVFSGLVSAVFRIIQACFVCFGVIFFSPPQHTGITLHSDGAVPACVLGMYVQCLTDSLGGSYQ